MMNKDTKRILELILCAAIIIGLTVVIPYVSQKHINGINSTPQQPVTPHR